MRVRPMRVRSMLAVVATFTGISGIVVVAGGPVPVGAATFTVTTTADVVNAADGVTSLREAFTAANASVGDDTIELGVGLTYVLTDCVAGPLVHNQVSVLTLDGNGSTLQQSCDATRLLVVDDPTPSRLDVRDIRLLGGPNASPTAVRGLAIDTTLTGLLGLQNVEITGFVSPGITASIVHAGMGHSTAPYQIAIVDSEIHDNTGNAVTGDTTSVRVTNSSIVDNAGAGLSIADGWPMIVEGSTISRNNGSGIATSGQGFLLHTFSISNSTISDNARVGFRCGQCGVVTITGSTFTGNGLTAAGQRRGGVSIELGRESTVAPSTLTITNSIITGNATNDPVGGGGLTVTSPLSDVVTAIRPVTTITGGLIGDNTTGGDGGGVRVDGGTLSINGTTISGNTADVDGGGIHYGDASGPYDLTLSGVTVQANTAGRNGGGLSADDTAAVQISGSTFAANTAVARGGAMHVRSLSLSLATSRITGNSSVEGGGLHYTGDGLAIRTSTLDANTTLSNGGAVFADVIGFGLVENSTLTGNTAGKGGGLAQVSGAFTIDHVTSASNTAIEGGDIWRPVAHPLTITRSALVSTAGGPCLIAAASTSSSVFSDASCGSSPTDLVTAADPQLGPLGANGGPTPTRLPATTSPLGGRVALAACTLTTDQRGTARPQGAACDAGAVEIVEAIAVAPIVGSTRADVLTGTANADVIRALGGNDLVDARGGADDVDGGDGADALFGGAGPDRLVGGNGPDLLDGGAGADVLIGGNGVDVLIVGVGDTADGGRGPDLCWFPRGSARHRLLNTTAEHDC